MSSLYENCDRKQPAIWQLYGSTKNILETLFCAAFPFANGGAPHVCNTL